MYVGHWNEKENKNWYKFQFSSNKYTTVEFYKLYDEIVAWMQQGLDNPYRHARWQLTLEHITVKFRYERDYLRFILTWS